MSTGGRASPSWWSATAPCASGHPRFRGRPSPRSVLRTTRLWSRPATSTVSAAMWPPTWRPGR
eukprot:10410956-Alexandrium_andersonii.AAC.1